MNRQIESLNLNDDEIYYGKMAGWQYMSVSQYKDFTKCEAAALAKLKNEFKPDFSSKALLVGNYVHSYFESLEAHKKFVSANEKELYSSRKPFGILKEFQIADKMIARIESERLFKYLWQGEREKVVTGELFGMEWKGKIDLLNVDKGYFIDLKTTAQLDKRFYNPNYGMYVSFVEEYGYVLQMAVYEQLLEAEYGKPFVGYIYAVTKQDVPDVAAIEIEAEKKRFELNLLTDRIERVEKVKTGQEEPNGCGHCAYCRQNKQLTGFVPAGKLI